MNRNGNDVPSSPLYTFYELLLPEFTEINSDGENLKQSELSSSKDEANNEMVTNNNIPHPIFHRLVFNSRNEIISTIDDYFTDCHISFFIIYDDEFLPFLPKLYCRAHRRILSTDVNKKNDGILLHIKLPNILPKIFQIILRIKIGNLYKNKK
ncbi:hypothetical protein GLOIN_2v1761764 [Rhizophagus irregularis DAOM 181602=DAOM 197198]|uniref:Uncharacterized protein n=1 Tax=Rhizophagus irregularis (strain DAOM 181602 / DAOM 197198 / MUCL 43194) TaxID=747089 RepID=A0A2P4QYX2_RHIID|nr:hypothetical protein GLOIN_2v1761764 [Rhizophagus irregularis DAOM 181602=DAOM 197198]POG82839.1 hypothetical protein GLOIN_2v1761764 [Rhizophagus irregularis DAOM 181602=DAOM 197198]|eukprot:XP_025189705.1 hypothetical protein GLOIN_2v1761764 [Rhizophagus irregularis DAOM 181602=DAOM 197198]